MRHCSVPFLSDNRKTSRVGISVIFTNEENIGRNRDTLYPSPIHEIQSSPETSPVPLKKLHPKPSLPYRKRGMFYF